MDKPAKKFSESSPSAKKEDNLFSSLALILLVSSIFPSASPSAFSGSGVEMSSALNPRCATNFSLVLPSTNAFNTCHSDFSSSDFATWTFSSQIATRFSSWIAFSKRSVAALTPESIATVDILTVDWRCAELVKLTNLPPKAKVAPAGRSSHLGVCPSVKEDVCALLALLKKSSSSVAAGAPVSTCGLVFWSVRIAILPSYEAVAMKVGLRGWKVVLNVQLVTTGNSPNISPVCGFQQMDRLSLPDDRSKPLSCPHHESDKTPALCPVRV